MRDSLVVYRNTIEVAKVLNKSDRLKFYEALFEYALYDKEPEDLIGNSLSFFNLTRPLIDANNKRYRNGCKGGRPKDDDSPKKDLGEGIEFVNLTEAQYEKLLSKYGEELLPIAIDVLDSWLSKNTSNAKTARNGNHYSYFRIDSWVINNAKEQIAKTQPNWGI